MKFAFYDKLVNSSSFIELCNVAQSYGFDGVEISNVKEEISRHTAFFVYLLDSCSSSRELYYFGQ